MGAFHPRRDVPLGLSCVCFLHQKVRDALVALRWISVGILSLFCVELSVVALAKGPLRFLRSPLDVLDVLVVACSLVFEIVLHGIAESVAGLLVVLRMWRVLYIMHEARSKCCFQFFTIIFNPTALSLPSTWAVAFRCLITFMRTR